MTQVVAILGKGGVGKTVLTALLARSALDRGIGPLLLVDADPTGGLVHALGANGTRTLGEVREQILSEARAESMDRDALANAIDWRVLATLEEHGRYSLLAMGRSEAQGCFCPVNALLRTAIEKLATGFGLVLLDAEAGLEQVSRQVIRQVDAAVLVSDASVRGLRAAGLLHQLLCHQNPCPTRIGLVLNRAARPTESLPAGLDLWGYLPEDPNVQRFDMQGRSLLDLPTDSPALGVASALLKKVGLFPVAL